MKRISVNRNSILFILTILGVIELSANNSGCQSDSASSVKRVYFTIKYGQGGFRDERSPIDKLGGGQLALQVRHGKLPLAVSVSREYYTNSAAPTNSYEISSMVSVNLLYSDCFLKNKRLNVFAGIGTGGMKVPQGNDKDKESGMLFNIESGINYRVVWKFGLHGTYKYLYAKKGDMINFNENIALFGITFNFGF